MTCRAWLYLVVHAWQLAVQPPCIPEIPVTKGNKCMSIVKGNSMDILHSKNKWKGKSCSVYYIHWNILTAVWIKLAALKIEPLQIFNLQFISNQSYSNRRKGHRTLLMQVFYMPYKITNISNRSLEFWLALASTKLIRGNNLLQKSIFMICRVTTYN